MLEGYGLFQRLWECCRSLGSKMYCSSALVNYRGHYADMPFAYYCQNVRRNVDGRRSADIWRHRDGCDGQQKDQDVLFCFFHAPALSIARYQMRASGGVEAIYPTYSSYVMPQVPSKCSHYTYRLQLCWLFPHFNGLGVWGSVEVDSWIAGAPSSAQGSRNKTNNYRTSKILV